MKQTVLWESAMIERVVYKDRFYQKPFENPIGGETGYVVIDYEERIVVYNDEFHIWHKPDLRLDKYKELLVLRLAGTGV